MSTEVIASLKESQSGIEKSIDMMKNFGPVPEALTKQSDQISKVLAVVSEVLQYSTEIASISRGMQSLEKKSLGFIFLRLKLSWVNLLTTAMI